MSSRDELLRIADIARIPREIFEWFFSTPSGFKTLPQIAAIRESDVDSLSKAYKIHSGEDSFDIFVSINLKQLIAWLQSYRNITGTLPPEGYITAKTYEDPHMGIKQDSNQYPMTPAQTTSTPNRDFIYGRFSSPTQATGYSGVSHSRRNVKISITEYPKFSGKAKDWISYERKFLAIASSQGLAYLLQEKEPTDFSEDIIKADKTYLYDAFNNSWAEGINFHLVQKHQATTDGRAVYLGAQKYFRGTAMKDSLIMECVSNLVNNKLTPNTFNGAEGFNNAFNDNLNTLQELDVKLDDTLIKCLYLNNITDKDYNTIKDHPQQYKSVDDVQTHILRKYVSSKGERRPGAPK